MENEQTSRQDRSRTSVLTTVLTVGLALFLGVLIGMQLTQVSTVMNWWKGESNATASAQEMKVFWEAWNEVKKSYYQPEDLDENELRDGATMGMVAAVGDPYTMYIPPDDNERVGEDMAGSFYGIGIELTYIDGVVGVQAPLPDTPADKAGLQARDVITHVKDELAGVDEDTYDWTTTKAQSVLRSKEKTLVTLTIFRKDHNNNEPFEVEVVRDEIVVTSVEMKFVRDGNGGKVAHVKLKTFGERTYDEWEKAVNEILREPQVEGIVLDLRNNPGGLFNEALHIADTFIDQGTIVSQEGRKKRDTQEFKANKGAKLAGYPVVVLVNGGSASSSEIVAGALRDQLGAKIVGEKTFGKGLVQERVSLSNGGGLHVTIAKWKLPGGDWIQEVGIEPEIEAKNDLETEVDEALEAAVAALQE